MPRKLRIDFLDENGQPQGFPSAAVVRIDRLMDPSDSKRILYVEKTLIRIVAILPGTDIIDVTASGYAMLTEQKNRDLELSKQLSYMGESNKIASLLSTFSDPQYSDTSADWTRIAISSGVSDIIALKSLAGPRKNFTGTAQKTVWLANVVARPTTRNLPRDFRDSSLAAVPQWADQGSFSLEAGSAQSTFTPQSVNHLHDWLEAHAWDVIGRMRQGSDPDATPFSTQVGAAVVDVRAPESGCSAAWYAYVCPKQIIRYDVSKFVWDSLRVDGTNDAIYHGLRVQGSHFLTENVQHEARHCWQGTQPDADSDGLPDSTLDPSEKELVPSLIDSPNVFRSGENREFDFLGPSGRDNQTVDQRAVRDDAIERDAVRWEARNAGSVVNSGLKCLNPDLVSSSSETTPIYNLGSVAIGNSASISLVAQALGPSFNRVLGLQVDRLSGILIRIKRETSPVPGESEPGNPDGRITDPVTNQAVVETIMPTDNLGSALFYITPSSGLNIFSITARHPNASGNGWGDLAGACGFTSSSPLYFKIRGN